MDERSELVDRTSTTPVEVAASSPVAVAASNVASATSSVKTKCRKCDKRMAKEGCTQTACIQCCTDMVGCESHKKQRTQALWKEQVLAGTTEVQRLAAQKREMRLQTSSSRRRFFFREPGFVYLGDTVVIWDVRAYASNPKWRDDAIRKSLRRKRAELPNSYETHRRLGNSRKRFSRIRNELFEKLSQIDEAVTK